jgi:hypothetical protein
MNENGFDWIRQTVCGDWGIEALFCIECHDDCDCPDDYECICYTEIETARRLRRRTEIESKLNFLNEGFLSPDHGKDDATSQLVSQQKPSVTNEDDSSQPGPKNKEAQRTRKLSKSSGYGKGSGDDDDGKGKGKGSRSCSGSSKDGSSCDHGEAGYCFRTDTTLVDDFDGGKKSGY